MSYKDDVLLIIKSLTGQHNVLTITKEFIAYTGDVPTALLLSQIIYWCDRSKRPDGFFYKSYVEWEEEIGLSEYQVRRSTNTLKKMRILETELKKANGSPTLHYKLNKDNFSESILKFLKNPICINSRIQSVETQESLTETTTETTTEITTNKRVSETPTINIKVRYAEFVTMKEDEYKKLTAEYGQEATNKMIEILDNHKGASGQSYKSDYRAILKWVIDAVKEKHPHLFKGGVHSGGNRASNLPFSLDERILAKQRERATHEPLPFEDDDLF